MLEPEMKMHANETKDCKETCKAWRTNNSDRAMHQTAVHSLLHPRSSDPSPQSSLPLQRTDSDIQRPLSHSNCRFGQSGSAGSELFC